MYLGARHVDFLLHFHMFFFGGKIMFLKQYRFRSHLGAQLGAVLGGVGAVLGSSGVLLGRSGAVVGTVLDGLGVVLG